jgi:hypothetical protein
MHNEWQRHNKELAKLKSILSNWRQKIQYALGGLCASGVSGSGRAIVQRASLDSREFI